MPVTLPAIAILGAGSMGAAILHGLVKRNVEVVGGIRVTNRTEAKAAPLRRDGVISLATESDQNANRAAVAGARLVLVAVKPALVPGVLEEIADALAHDAIVISAAAGVTTETMQSLLPPSVASVRVMSNTPTSVGLGVTGIAAGSRATRDDVDLVSQVFSAVGEVVLLPEDKLDAVTALSGTGPAYVYYVIESFTKTAIEMGFTAAEAEKLVIGTFRGAVELLRVSGLSPEELRRQVTSPGGTTERAIASLEQARLADVFGTAIEAAAARSRELASGS
jgi:pyrroline-5-carboxylate reductase